MTGPTATYRDLLANADAIAILTHERPDGDAVGSLLALARALTVKGKGVISVLRDGVPGRFRFLPGADGIQGELPKACDLLVTVDCSDIERLGFPADELPRQPDLNIDHHPTNTQFAAHNLVEPAASATAQVLYRWMPAWDLTIDLPVATNLLAGLVTDTIGFRTASTSPDALRMAAELMELGAPLSEIYEQTLSRKSFVAAQYWGLGLSRLQRDDGIVWTSLTLEDRRQVDYPGPDDADLINQLTTIEEAKIAIVFVEQPGRRVKVSWRAQPGINVAEVATQFGGGGHEPAAGAMVGGTLDEVRDRVLGTTRESLSIGEKKLP